MDTSYPNRDVSAIPPLWRPPALAVKDLAIGPLPGKKAECTGHNSPK